VTVIVSWPDGVALDHDSLPLPFPHTAAKSIVQERLSSPAHVSFFSLRVNLASTVIVVLLLAFGAEPPHAELLHTFPFVRPAQTQDRFLALSRERRNFNVSQLLQPHDVRSSALAEVRDDKRTFFWT
jgi:hypothetical protein